MLYMASVAGGFSMSATDPQQEKQPEHPQLPPPILNYAGPGAIITGPNTPAIIGIFCLIAFPIVVSIGQILQSHAFQRRFGLTSQSLLTVVALLGLAVSPMVAILFASVGVGYAKANHGRGRLAARICQWVGTAELLFFFCFVLLPSLGAAKERTLRVKCCSNLKQIGTAIQLYLDDSHGIFPPDLGLLLTQTDLSAQVLVCPASDEEPAEGPDPKAVAQKVLKEKGHLSYIYVYPGPEMTSGKISVDYILAYEPLANHLQEGMNILFGDGHVEWCSKAQAVYVISELNAGFNPPRPQQAPLGGAAPGTLPGTLPATP
jgi:prepilin-type processing-associated H-X9-DG protein